MSGKTTTPITSNGDHDTTSAEATTWGPHGDTTAEGSHGNWWSIACVDETEHTAPDGGTAVPVCGGPPLQDTRCQLDGSTGDCPDGMGCASVGPGRAAMLCAWPAP